MVVIGVRPSDQQGPLHVQQDHPGALGGVLLRHLTLALPWVSSLEQRCNRLEGARV